MVTFWEVGARKKRNNSTKNDTLLRALAKKNQDKTSWFIERPEYQVIIISEIQRSQMNQKLHLLGI